MGVEEREKRGLSACKEEIRTGGASRKILNSVQHVSYGRRQLAQSLMEDLVRTGVVGVRVTAGS